jgi:polyisoprenoid-binding protein YceI
MGDSHVNESLARNRQNATPFLFGVTALVAATLAQAEPAAARLLPEKSQIVFASKQMGVPVEGTFGSFRAQVAFNPHNLEGSAVALYIDTGSALLGVPEVDSELPKATWFDVAQFPQASFKSSTIKALGGGRFEIAGQLTIKGQVQELVVPVMITQGHGQSIASGSFTIQRLAFKVGDGTWADTSIVSNDVKVRFKLTLAGLGPL